MFIKIFSRTRFNATIMCVSCSHEQIDFKIRPEVFGPLRKKTCLRRFVNNTGADQPEHPHSLISAFVIRFLKSIIRNLVTGEISFCFILSL